MIGFTLGTLPLSASIGKHTTHVVDEGLTSVCATIISVCIRPYLVYVKCRFHIRFHIGLYIQGLGITDGNISG